MPNHCLNTLKLINSENDQLVDSLAEFMVEDPEQPGKYALDFEKILPPPKKIKRSVSFGWSPNSLIGWRVKHWGTKWNSYENQVSDDGSEISFVTAWDPPIPLVKKLAKITGLDLRMTYVETGMGFCGVLKARAKTRSTNQCYNIPDAPEELAKELNVQNYMEW